jgi:hypothetical protein
MSDNRRQWLAWSTSPLSAWRANWDEDTLHAGRTSPEATQSLCGRTLTTPVAYPNPTVEGCSNVLPWEVALTRTTPRQMHKEPWTVCPTCKIKYNKKESN